MSAWYALLLTHVGLLYPNGNATYVLAWANCVVYPVLERQCEGLLIQDGQKQAPAPFFVYMQQTWIMVVV